MKQIPKKDKVYERFKRHVPDTVQPEALKAIIKEIGRYSEHYVRIALLEENDRELRTYLKNIHALNIKVTFPFLLGVYEDYIARANSKSRSDGNFSVGRELRLPPCDL